MNENNLLDFLAERDISALTAEIKVSSLVPYDFKIKALTKAKRAEFQNRCKSPITKSGADFDSAKFQTLICIECCTYPNFSSAELIEKLGVATPADAVGKVLLPGEEDELYAQICKLSGFENDVNKDIKEAKK